MKLALCLVWLATASLVLAAPDPVEVIKASLARRAARRTPTAPTTRPNVNGFQAVSPGGDTTCVAGDPYTFFWRAGTSGNLTVFFEGGGACWDSSSCLLPIYSRTVIDTASGLDDSDGFISSDSRSPVTQDTILFIPYCTADVHIGNNTANYGLYTMAHRGRVNVEAALDFIQKQVTRPAQVNVAGCSAGSLGAFLNAPYVFKRFPGAKYKVWGDSEVGIVAPAQWPAAYKNWNLQLAPWIPALAPAYTENWTPVIAGYILAESAMFYPDSEWAAYTSNADVVQGSFYAIGGGTDNWTTLMRAQFDAVRANATNVASFIAPGNAHCRDDSSAYWSTQSAGVNLYDWVNQLFQGSSSFNPNVDCSPNC